MINYLAWAVSQSVAVSFRTVPKNEWDWIKQEILCRDKAWRYQARVVHKIYINLQKHWYYLLNVIFFQFTEWITVWMWRENLNSDDCYRRAEDGHSFHRDHLNQKRRRGRNITCQSCDRASLHSHITKTRDSLKCLLHWASGRNRTKMTAVRWISAESEVDLYTVTPQRLVYLKLLCSPTRGVILSQALSCGYIMASSVFLHEWRGRLRRKEG